MSPLQTLDPDPPLGEPCAIGFVEERAATGAVEEEGVAAGSMGEEVDAAGSVEEEGAAAGSVGEVVAAAGSVEEEVAVAGSMR